MRLMCRFVVFFLPMWVAGCSPGAPPPSIVIGQVSDKTRPDQAGDRAELGIRLALNHLDNEKLAKEFFGGRKIEVRHTDARGQLDAFESQAVRLDSVNRCLALFSNAKVPLLTMHGQQVAGASNFVFYLGMSPARQGAALAGALAEDIKVKRITLLIDEKRPESVALADAFTKAMGEARKDAKAPPAAVLSVRYAEETNTPPRIAEDVKWRELIERVIAQEPQVVVFAGSVQDFNTWQKIQRKEYLVAHPRIVYAGSDGDHRRFDLDPGDKVAITLATAYYADPASEKIAAFTKAYQEAFQTEPDVNAAIAYDGFRVLVEAMKGAGTQLTPDRLREELLKTKDFDGLTGPLSITGDRQVQRPLFVVSWQGGAMKLIKAFSAP
jgi:ABC-type branched-subunit amino acid transport system substrate-binding protein